MLTIRKANFENEPCFCCTGTKKYLNNPQYCHQQVLYHKLPDEKKHIQALIVIPKCEHCASKTSPATFIAIILSLTSLVASFFWMYSTNGWFLSLRGSLIHCFFAFSIFLSILGYVFNFVYRQLDSNYEIVRVMIAKYGWQTNMPKEGQKDFGFTEEYFTNMLDDLVNIYGCEISDTPTH